MHPFALLLLVLFAAPSFAFDLEGHRGTRGLAPENTLAAFRRAIDIGVTTIETDMAVTKDDVIVISHDPFLNPDLVRDPEGHWLASKGPPIHTLTLAELQRYQLGRINPMSQYAVVPQVAARVVELNAHVAYGKRMAALAKPLRATELLASVLGAVRPNVIICAGADASRALRGLNLLWHPKVLNTKHFIYWGKDSERQLAAKVNRLL